VSSFFARIDFNVFRAVRYLTAGYGLIDLHLLASVLITPGTKLWTLDKRLARLAERFGWLTQHRRQLNQRSSVHLKQG